MERLSDYSFEITNPAILEGLKAQNEAAEERLEKSDFISLKTESSANAQDKSCQAYTCCQCQYDWSLHLTEKSDYVSKLLKEKVEKELSTKLEIVKEKLHEDLRSALKDSLYSNSNATRGEFMFFAEKEVKVVLNQFKKDLLANNYNIIRSIANEWFSEGMVKKEKFHNNMTKFNDYLIQDYYRIKEILKQVANNLPPMEAEELNKALIKTEDLNTVNKAVTANEIFKLKSQNIDLSSHIEVIKKEKKETTQALFSRINKLTEQLEIEKNKSKGAEALKKSWHAEQHQLVVQNHALQVEKQQLIEKMSMLHLENQKLIEKNKNENKKRGWFK